MIKLSVEQHAQILGFALIGFGLGWTLDLVAALWKMGQIPEGALQDSFQAAFSSEIIILLARAILAVAAGTVIRMMMSDPKVLGILFVFASIYVFPLGTILSASVLVYSFVIHPTESQGYVDTILSS